MQLIQQSCRLVLAAAIALSFFSFQWHETYWIVISTLLAMQFCPPILWRKQAILLLNVGMVTAALTVASHFFASYIFYFAIFLMMTTGVMTYLGVTHALMWGLAFVTNLIVILAGRGVVTNAINVEIFFCILMGFIIASLLQIIFFPARLKSCVKSGLSNCLTSLSQLNRAIFSCFTSRDYALRHYTYEIQLHERRADFLYAITKTKKLRNEAENKVFSAMIDKMDHLYEIILSLGRLLHRVEDYATFDVANVEFNALSTSITNCFQDLIDKLSRPNVSLDIDAALTSVIFQLEEVNRSALQVVAREPIVFMFFINDLNELKEILSQLSEDIGNLVGGER